MGAIRVKVSPEVEVDADLLTKAIRMAVDGADVGELWSHNPIPVISQLEEAVYVEGRDDLAHLYVEVLDGLDLPTDTFADTTLRKAMDRAPQTDQEWVRWLIDTDEDLEELAQRCGEDIHHDLQKALGRRAFKEAEAAGQQAFGFEGWSEAEEEEHPREKAGETLPGYKPGEFIPKNKQPAQDAPEPEPEPPAAPEPPPLSFEEKKKQITDEYLRRENKFSDLLSQVSERLKNATTPEEKKALQEEHDYITDTHGMLHKRYHLQLLHLKTEFEGTEAPPDIDETREEARRLRQEDQKLNKELVPLSDPRRVELQKRFKELFLLADRLEGTTPAYLKFRENIVRDQFKPKRQELFQRLEEAVTGAEKDALFEQIGANSAAEADAVYELQKRAVWLEEAEAEQRERDLRDQLGDKAYERLQQEKAAAQEYEKRTRHTGIGFDRRQKATRVPPKGRVDLGDMNRTRRLAEGLPEETRFFSPEDEEKAQNKTVLWGKVDVTVHGPWDTDNAFWSEAKAMQRRVAKAFPTWLHKHMQDRGVTMHVSAASVARMQFHTQPEFFEWMKKNPALSNGEPPDIAGGCYYGSKKQAWTRVGDSLPGSRTGSLCTEIHEYAHAIDACFRLGGRPIHDLPEWKAIHKDLEPYVDEYNKQPWELFAEGLTAYVWSKESRDQMLQGPPQWQRMGKFFQQLLNEKKGSEVMNKALDNSEATPNPEPEEQPEQTTEGTEDGIPEGWEWKSQKFPAPDGNGFIILDGIGPTST